MSRPSIDSNTLHQWLQDAEELAVLDLRGEGEFIQHGAPLFASNLPLAQVEEKIGARVPRKDVRVVLLDGGDGTAHAAQVILDSSGYTQVHVLAGGLPTWIASGHASTFSVPPPQFTAQVREKFGTPAVLATELNELYRTGADVIVLDSRTVEEFERGHVPRAISAPGGELVYRFADLVPSAQTLVLVSCAGNPRGVIGAQTLINAGVPNRVAVLEEGTKGWQQAGLELEAGSGRRFGPVSPRAAAYGKQRAAQLQQAYVVQDIDDAALASWQTEADRRTTYLLDVRTPEEYLEAHIPGSISAPGGQLILGTLRYVAVRGARLVLVDDTGVRGITAAHWLQQRGWEVGVHRFDAQRNDASLHRPVAPDLRGANAAA